MRVRTRVTQERVNGWMQFLDEFEAVPKGTKLIDQDTAGLFEIR
jgi:hypothetical protein